MMTSSAFEYRSSEAMAECWEIFVKILIECSEERRLQILVTFKNAWLYMVHEGHSNGWARDFSHTNVFFQRLVNFMVALAVTPFQQWTSKMWRLRGMQERSTTIRFHSSIIWFYTMETDNGNGRQGEV